jgi:2-methylisocitrate lyase-like PEP mutase family enzyme
VSVEDVLATVRRLVAAVDLPVSADVEGGYATTPEGCR